MKEGEVVVISGASAGVGRATARVFARHGAKVGLLARGIDGLNAAKKEVEQLGGKALVLQADVAQPDQVENAAQQVEKLLGPIDIWINNAMVSVFSPFKDMTPQEFKRVTEVTYLGQVYGTMAALKRMLTRDRGMIVQVGSALADRSIPLQSAYCGAKHGVRGFTDSIRSELYHDGSNIHICMVQLPALNTPQFEWERSRLKHKTQPVPPIFQPEVAADAIFYAAHHKKREMYVGGPTVKAMWANKFFAGLIDRYLGKIGYKAQQTDELENADRPDNLYNPLQGDFGAHGRFDKRAHKYSIETWFSKHAKAVGAASVLAGAAVIWLAVNAKRRNA